MLRRLPELGWAIQALIVLWIAGKLQSEFIRHVAYLLYVIVLGQYAFIDLPSHYLAASVEETLPGEYFGLPWSCSPVYMSPR